MFQTKDSSVIMKTLILLALFGIASAQINEHPDWKPKQVAGHPEWKPRGIFFSYLTFTYPQTSFKEFYEMKKNTIFFSKVIKLSLDTGTSTQNPTTDTTTEVPTTVTTTESTTVTTTESTTESTTDAPCEDIMKTTKCERKKKKGKCNKKRIAKNCQKTCEKC